MTWARVKSRLDVGAVGHVQWLGLLPTWTQIVVGPEFNGRRAINLDSGEGARGAGRGKDAAAGPLLDRAGGVTASRRSGWS